MTYTEAWPFSPVPSQQFQTGSHLLAPKAGAEAGSETFPLIDMQGQAKY